MPRFVVGTGRCGSTLLDHMLGLHSDVLVLSEFFATFDRGRGFVDGDVTGEMFADVLARPNPYAVAMARLNGGDPRDDPRWRDNGGLPGIMLVALPGLSDDATALFDDIMAWARERPAQEFGAHLHELFDWLTSRFGKRVWIERSGLSNEFSGRLRAMYPDARFVHIHRNGVDTALSMYEHPFFPMFASYLFDPPSSEEVDATALGLELDGRMPFAHRVLDKVPIAWLGSYWSYQVAAGFRGLAGLGADRRLDVRYEDLVGATEATLDAIAEFFDLGPSDGWAARAASLLQPVEARAERLTPAERQELERACLPGEILLGRAEAVGLEPLWWQMRERMRPSTGTEDTP